MKLLPHSAVRHAISVRYRPPQRRRETRAPLSVTPRADARLATLGRTALGRIARRQTQATRLKALSDSTGIG